MANPGSVRFGFGSASSGSDGSSLATVHPVPVPVPVPPGSGSTRFRFRFRFHPVLPVPGSFCASCRNPRIENKIKQLYMCIYNLFHVISFVLYLYYFHIIFIFVILFFIFCIICWGSHSLTLHTVELNGSGSRRFWFCPVPVPTSSWFPVRFLPFRFDGSGSNGSGLRFSVRFLPCL